MNQIKTALLLGLLTGILMLLGGLIGGRNGMMIAFFIAAAMNFASYWWSDKIVLSLYRAQPLEQASSPNLYAMVGELCQRAGLPMPRLYVIEDDTPNAFATGRDPEHAVVAMTSGILRILTPRELRGVISHELSHVKDRDILISSVAATLAGAIMFLANMARWGAIFGGGSRDNEEGGGGGMGAVGLIVMSILAPIGAMLIQMAVSRSREYLADQEGGAMSGDPLALAAALNKLENANRVQPMADAPAQTAHMFIVNPLSGAAFANLFSTHPPIPERIARLQEQAAAQGQGGYVAPPPPPSGYAPPPPPPPPPASGGGSIDWS